VVVDCEQARGGIKQGLCSATLSSSNAIKQQACAVVAKPWLALAWLGDLALLISDIKHAQNI